jgi:hypothetical protein
MRVISPQLEAHFGSDMTTLATCWKIIRLDGEELGFTDHDQVLTVDGLDYDSIAGFTPTTVESKSNNRYAGGVYRPTAHYGTKRH